jgi:hypothetical protein
MNTKHYLTAAGQAFLVSILAVAVLAAGFFMAEPQVGQAQTSTFTVKQTITDEISFLVLASNVVMNGSLQGITGGTANGSTTAVVQTNNSAGYNMTIAFFNNGTPNAMVGDTTASQAIRDYPAVANEPTYLFSTASTSSVFGYTVSGSDNADIDNSFKDNGSACNSGAGFTVDRCWMEPRTTAFGIVNKANEASTGATTTIHFRVHVPNNPSPAVLEDVYTATATLTALNN